MNFFSCLKEIKSYMDLITNRTKTVKFLSSKCNVEIKNGTSNQKQDNFNKLKNDKYKSYN